MGKVLAQCLACSKCSINVSYDDNRDHGHDEDDDG